MKYVHEKNSCLCDIYDKSFRDKSELNKHKLHIHSRVSHSCDHDGCSKTFQTRSALLDHLKLKHIPTKAKVKLKCDQYDKVLDRIYILEAHMILHSGSASEDSKCPDCGSTRKTVLQEIKTRC